MELLTTAEVAKRLRVSVATVNRYAREGLLPAVELPSGQRRYRVIDIDRITDAGPEKAAS